MIPRRSGLDRIGAIASLIALTGGFLALVGWFSVVDHYHRHFFESGSLVLTYNLVRIAFVCFLAWIIYAPGYAVIAATVPKQTLDEFTIAERCVLGFGTGAGLWRIVMLILGVSQLYYQPLIVALCCIVLVASAAHFNDLLGAFWGRAATGIAALRRGEAVLPIVAGAVTIVAAVWLLLVRGLYPGGAGDHYTHYFYYYHDVIKNHGLAPNDVWYHYYYSKGAGLFFLGMLLSDPEALQLVTFCTVIFAALALATLSARLAPRSLWPAFSATIYLIFYIVALRPGDGGEFQKSHEEVSALVVIAAWAVCMYSIRPRDWEIPCFILGASATIGATLLTQAIGVFLALFFGIHAVWALATQNFRRMWYWGLLSASAGIATASVLLLNYLVTGLATDQALDLTWRLADFERLARWGVIPDLAVVAWIRDNYELVAKPFGWASVQNLRDFMRLDTLWIALGSGFVVLAARALSGMVRSRIAPSRTAQPEPDPSTPHPETARRTLVVMGSLIATFAVLSVAAGHSQSVSYTRFSTFFFPLIILFVVACWGVSIAGWANRSCGWVTRAAVPCLLLIALPLSWNNWFSRIVAPTQNAWRFAGGQYSLADAYSHQIGDAPNSAINPGALEAMRHVEPGARIWSTNVDSYCMAPECRIESVVSVKMSSHLNEILNGPAEQARDILQQEGLNYFLFSTQFHLVDLLPYSRLFAPGVIGDYLAIKWTDGETYLLTWQGSNTTPIGPQFLRAYIERLSEPENPWFRFSKFLPHLRTIMATFDASPHPWHAIAFPWRHAPLGIDVVSATYGANCSEFTVAPPDKNLVSVGNATGALLHVCFGEMQCAVTLKALQLADPAPGCAKGFRVTYHCGSDAEDFEVALPGNEDVLGRTIMLDCPSEPPHGITVISATYGMNCQRHYGRQPIEKTLLGNATLALKEACSGKPRCDFLVDVNQLGDPDQSCTKSKTFEARYRCPSGPIKTSFLAEEANGKTTTLACDTGP